MAQTIIPKKNRLYSIIDINDLPLVDFSHPTMITTSFDTVRKNKDNNKCIISYYNEPRGVLLKYVFYTEQGIRSFLQNHEEWN